MSHESKSMSIPSAIVLGAVVIAIAIIIAFGGGKKNNVTAPVGSAVEDASIGIFEAAKKVGVKEKALEECLASDIHVPAIQGEMMDAQKTGGRGTPHSVIVGPNGETLTIGGAQPYEVWVQAIDGLLAGTITTPEGDLSKNVVPVNETDRIRGNVNAPITIIEYSDIDCPFCKRVHPVVEQIIAERPEQVRWVYRHWPIAQLHPNAPEKAEAVECVGSITENNEKYWEYLDLLILGTK